MAVYDALWVGFAAGLVCVGLAVVVTKIRD